jgi:hypothetical protein
MSSNAKDILDKINNLYNSSIDNPPVKGYGSRNPYMPEDKKLITIKNPERLNGKGLTITKGWNIEYQGRDLSLEEDNYRWDIHSDYSGERGYYIIQRELVNGDWFRVRWGKLPTNAKERIELIDKSRLKDKRIIQMDMISAINHSIGFKDFKTK